MHSYNGSFSVCFGTPLNRLFIQSTFATTNNSRSMINSPYDVVRIEFLFILLLLETPYSSQLVIYVFVFACSKFSCWLFLALMKPVPEINVLFLAMILQGLKGLNLRNLWRNWVSIFILLLSQLRPSFSFKLCFKVKGRLRVKLNIGK